MKLIFNPHPYQQYAGEHLRKHTHAALFLDMGLGKTVITLTELQRLKDAGNLGKTLIIAPKRVTEHTWTDEAAKWAHLAGLRISVVAGAEKARKQALSAKADVFCISRDNVAWLTAYLSGAWPFEVVVIDELSSFKNQDSKRFKALTLVLPYAKRVWGLTGTPAPNGLLDLWAQIYLLDRGERLGKTLTQYRETYFNAFHKPGMPVASYRIKSEQDPLFGKDIHEKMIHSQIADICISMKARDWLDMPERLDIVTHVHLPKSVIDQYNDFEYHKVMELLESGETITGANAAAMFNKLLQFANGAIYDENRDVQTIHDYKLEALGERLEAANGKPVLVLYAYQHDVTRIKSYLKEFKPQDMQGKDVIQRWNDGKIPVLLGHPASMGHGLNMQRGGNLLEHFGNTPSLELYQQVIARLDRQGQTERVRNNRLITLGTVDERVLQIQEDKAATQNSLIDAVKAIINKHVKH